MTERHDKPRGEPSVHDRHRALDEQLKRLVKAEQRLYLSQRALASQLKRVDALNRFALAAAHAREPQELFDMAFRLFFELFPYEQAIGLLAKDDGSLSVVAVGAVEGRQGDGAAMQAVLDEGKPVAIDVPVAPLLDVWIGSEVRPLRELFERLFGEGDTKETPTLLVPLAERDAKHRSVIVMRRLDQLTSFHEELPGRDDVPFLELMSQQIAAALANARLVATLRRSYQDLERTQAELLQRERLATAGELAAVVAHEVRNPLAAIMNSSALLQRVARPAEEVAALLAIMDEETRRLEQIVSDFLDFARPDKLTRASTSVAAVASEAVDSALAAAEEHGVTVTLKCAGEALAAVDEHMLRRALLNLITNAAQASVTGDTVRVGVKESDDHVTINVSDSGCGMRPEQIERVFEPFFTTKATGTGLGLTVVKRFADAHSGSVRITSRPGQGSVFTLQVPALRD